MELPKPTAQDSTTARESGEYFKIASGYVEAGVCVFCNLEETGQFPLSESDDGKAKLLLNKFPRSKFDMLAITTRHVETIDQLLPDEILALHQMKLLGRRLLQEVLGRKNIFFMNRDGGDKTVPHYHDQIQSWWPGLVTWSLEDGRGDDLDQKALMLKEAIERLKR
jgi:diadenosine tetraphosphate (Ap4A) HIT family hydrolase